MRFSHFAHALVLVVFALEGLAQPTTRPAAAFEVDRAYLRENFAKSEYMVPMRDGVKLHTAVYVPKGRAGKLPVLLIRTPYSVGGYGEGEWPEPKAEMRWLGKDGFIFVLQDVRGRYKSEGTFVHVRPLGMSTTDERTDSWDTVDWVVRHVEGNNGRVGLVGMSYPGFYASCGMIDAHPAVKCAIPQAPIGDWFEGDDVHRNGALNLAASYRFLRSFGPRKDEGFGTPDGYEFFMRLGAAGHVKGLDGPIGFWDEVMGHPEYDEYWKARDIRPHLKGVRVPVMNVGGWYDLEDLFGVLETYRHVERENPGIQNVLVMGPWSHGQWIRGDGKSLGDVSFGSETAYHYLRKVELPFLNHYLKGGVTEFNFPEAVVFETGANAWRAYAEWPPAGAVEREVYLRAGGVLSDEGPKEGEGEFAEWVSDPARPVPYTERVTVAVPREYMIEDQRFAARRPDVVVFQTEVLEEDVTVVGPVGVELRVSTTGADADWVVKLIDVYPDDEKDPEPNPGEVRMGGYQQLVRGDIMRGRFREGLEKGVPFEAGKVTKVAWEMPDVNHTFKRGHRMMVQVQGSWFPLFDRNPQAWVDPYHAKPAEYVKAVQRVWHGRGEASKIRIRVMPQAR